MNLLICIDNTGYEASLEARELHQSLADEKASALGMVRVVDESGEDYLYAAGLFEPITLGKQLEGRLFSRRASRRPLAA